MSLRDPCIPPLPSPQNIIMPAAGVPVVKEMEMAAMQLPVPAASCARSAESGGMSRMTAHEWKLGHLSSSE